jgi:hypothetical protein
MLSKVIAAVTMMPRVNGEVTYDRDFLRFFMAQVILRCCDL